MALPAEVLESFPDDLRNEPSLVDFNDVSGLAKSFVETKKMNGAMVRIPTAEDDDETIERYYTKMRPESAEKYEVNMPDQMAEGVEWNDDLVKGFTTHAHKNGLTQRQMQMTIDWWMETMGNVRGEHVKTVEEGEALLSKEWGGDYKKHKEAMARGYTAMNDPKLAEFLHTSGLGNHPSIANVFRMLGEAGAEDHGGPPAITEDAKILARDQISATREDGCVPGKPERERCAYHRGDRNATAKMDKLYAVAYGNG